MSEKHYISENGQLMAEWDWEKNNALGINPKSFTLGSDKKVWWICDKGHSYEARIANKNHGQGCPYCAGKKVLVGFNDLQTWCIQNNRLDLIEEFDSRKNNFTIHDITRGSGKKVWWKCPNGHSYNTTLNHRIKMNTGCGICSHKVFSSGHNDLLTTNPEIAEEFDVEKNGITPDQVMAGSNNKKYWFLCPKGHSYSATLLNRKKGRNCPICAKEMHISFPEKAIVFYLMKYNFVVKESYHAPYLKNKEFDIYIEDVNIAIEYDGKAWHKNIKRDIEKDSISDNNGVKLIRIREIGCPDYDSSSIKYYVTAESIRELEEAIRFVIRTANTAIEANNNLDINIERDRTLIYELMELSEKSNSILSRRPEVEIFWDKELNGILNPDQVSFSSTKVVKFVCPEGHKWEGKVRNFYLSPRCPFCSGEQILAGYNDLGTTHTELRAIWSEKNPRSIENYTYGSNETVLWKCTSCNGEYSMRIAEKAIKKYGCPYCNNRKLLNDYNDLYSCNKVLSEEFDSEKNGVLPSQVIYGGNQVFWWKCSKNHSYQATIFSRRKGYGCPYCNSKKVLVGYNDLLTLNPQLAGEWHPTKNGIQKPQDFTVNSHKNVWWECKNGHVFQETIDARNRGYGCPICSNHRILQGYNDLQTINPILAAEFDVQKNNGKTPAEFTPKSGKKVWWLCSKCGHSWAAQIIKRNGGQGCPACAGKVVVEGMNDLSTRYPSIAEDWDYVKNNPLMPTQVMPRSRKEVWWKCKKCGYEWEQKIINRTRATRCPKCGK